MQSLLNHIITLSPASTTIKAMLPNYNSCGCIITPIVDLINLRHTTINRTHTNNNNKFSARDASCPDLLVSWHPFDWM